MTDVPMQSWRVRASGPPSGLALESIDRPAVAPNHVLVRTAACALNFSDLLMIAGTYQVRPPLPFTPGQEIAGVVVEAPASSKWRAGDRVASKVFWGGFADYATAREDMLIRVPDALDLADAATLPVVWPTAWIALHDRARLEAGETVLVHAGAGGLGLACVQLAKAAGARVIATVGSADKVALCRAAGADEAIDYRGEDWVTRVQAITAGRGADVIVDPVGGEVTESSMKCLARRGRLLLAGFSSGTIPSLRANRLLLKNASALGVYWSHDDDGPLVASSVDAILALAARGAVKIAASKRYRFEALPQALDDLAARRTVGKVVLEGTRT